MSEQQPEQERLFDLTRFSPATVAAYLHLPKANARSFAVASALGRVISEPSSFAPLRPGKVGIGSVIVPKLRDAILRELGIGQRTWELDVTYWVQRGLAHRCTKGVVCLFVRPFELECPHCRVELLREASLRDNTKDHFASSEASLRATVPNSGVANGMKRGMEDLEVLNSSGVEANEGQADGEGPVLESARVFKNRERSDTDRQVRPDTGQTPWCLRCQRYGLEHVGGHVREWPSMRRGAW